MSSRKEEERNEKIIRGLMKLPPNRRCINCNSLGPQYVCTNFWTFVCMTCSGIHREFTHRVKSVSMSKFTSQEVEALQEGGNQRARETFLSDWDPRGQRLPDNSNVDKVREFIKSVYVDKKFFASKASGKPPRDIPNLRNHEDETRRASSYHSYSQSPPYDYQYEERRYGKQAPALTKKPGSDRGMFRFLSTSHLSDHVQEDRFANEVSNARVSDYSVSSGGDPFRSDIQSPTRRRGSGFSSPSCEASRDILSEDVQPYSVNTFSNLEAKGDPDQVTHPQRTDSSGSIGQLTTDGIGFKSLNSVGKEILAPTSEQSAMMQHNKDSTLPSLPHSSDSLKFDGLDLFRAPYAPQTITSTPAIDLFQLSDMSSALSVNSLQPPLESVAPTSSVKPQSQGFGTSLDLFSALPQQHAETLKDKTPDMVIQKNEGWATFDMPWHVEPSQGIKSLIPVSETSTSNESLGKFDQALSLDASSHWSGLQNFSTDGPSSLMQNPWHGGVHKIGAPLSAMNSQPNISEQSWSSFEESTTPFESIYAQSSEQVHVQDPSAVDPYLVWGISEDGAQLHEFDTKSRNPFDLPNDSDLESSNVFLDMSSLQSALPNQNMSTAWFPESAAIPYAPGRSQDALVFMSGQAPSRQIPNIQAQGPVASIGGNPFG